MTCTLKNVHIPWREVRRVERAQAHTHDRALRSRVHHELRVKRKKKKKREGNVLSKFAPVPPPLSGASHGPGAHPSPVRSVPGAILHADPTSFTSHTKHPVSANQAEVLVGPANERVWCQRAVFRGPVHHLYEEFMRMKVRRG